MTGWLLQRLMSTRFVNIVNILADSEIVPEHLQENCEPVQLAASLQAILDDPKRKAAILTAQEAAISKLGGQEPPSMRAAKVVLSVVSKWSAAELLQPPKLRRHLPRVPVDHRPATFRQHAVRVFL